MDPLLNGLDPGAEAAVRDSAFADLLVRVITIAARERPAELRRAIGSVFDLRQWEKQAWILSARYTDLVQKVDELQARLVDAQRSLEERP